MGTPVMCTVTTGIRRVAGISECILLSPDPDPDWGAIFKCNSRGVDGEQNTEIREYFDRVKAKTVSLGYLVDRRRFSKPDQRLLVQDAGS